MDFGCYRIWTIGPVVDDWEVLGSSHQAQRTQIPSLIRYPQLNESQRGGRKGHLYYSLVSIRKNVF